MQHSERLFPVTGSVALKPRSNASRQARIIAFPQQLHNNSPRAHTETYDEASRIFTSLKAFTSKLATRIDQEFSVSAGTARGTGPRNATKGETASIFIITSIITFLALTF